MECGGKAKRRPEHYTDLARQGLRLPTRRLGWRSRIYAGSDGRNTSVVVSCHRTSAATPVGVELSSVHLPRVARSSQPWALMRNPFGIGLRNETFEIQQSALPSGKICVMFRSPLRFAPALQNECARISILARDFINNPGSSEPTLLRRKVRLSAKPCLLMYHSATLPDVSSTGDQLGPARDRSAERPGPSARWLALASRSRGWSGLLNRNSFACHHCIVRAIPS